jgi:hypothetical protein
MGATVGEPGRVDRQRETIRAALALLSTATSGGTLITIPTPWRR